MKTLSVVSGGFDPIHSGHIEYIKAARNKGDLLVVCLNSDKWLQKKKGKSFLPFHERKVILESLKYVDLVLDFEDDGNGSCINGLKKIQMLYPDYKITFCNGGDRNAKNIPEMTLSNIDFQFSVGGSNKANSSSWILKEWNYHHEERLWGSFYNLFEDQGLKVKELIVSPKKGMSFQRHFKRNEVWFISEGSCSVNYSKQDPDNFDTLQLHKNDLFRISIGEWHQIFNPNDTVCKIIEIQFGEDTIEEDIERLFYFEDPSGKNKR